MNKVKRRIWPTFEVHTLIPGAWETEAGGPQVRGQPEQVSLALSQKQSLLEM